MYKIKKACSPSWVGIAQATVLLFLTILLFNPANAQERTVGVFLNDERAFDGLTLFNPLASKITYLIDNEGRVVNTWSSRYSEGLSVYLLEDGSLLRPSDPGKNTTFVAGGDAGLVERFDWDGSLLWQFRYTNEEHRLHHDIEPLPNGNILMIAWELKGEEDIIVAGVDTSRLAEGVLWPDHIIEVMPTDTTGGDIVWEWHVWDHLIQDFDSTKANYGVVEDHPELIDINYLHDGRADWNHLNAVNYNPELDQIVLCGPMLNEIWVIDHSTTTEEAAGHAGGKSGMGGDILYRWGNPRVHRRGNSTDQRLFFQHDAQWIRPGLTGAGNILIFNNGRGRREGAFTTIDEITPTLDENGLYLRPTDSAFGPTELAWSYRAPTPTDFFSPVISGTQRLANGNTLICSGTSGTFFEVTPKGDMVWKYINPVTTQGILAQGDTIPVAVTGSLTNAVFRSTRYGFDFPGFAGRNLTPGDLIEIEPTTSDQVADMGTPDRFMLSQNYPNPFNPATNIEYQIEVSGPVNMTIYNTLGQTVRILVDRPEIAGSYKVRWDGRNDAGVDVPSGVYIYRLMSGASAESRKLLLIR